MLRKVTSNILKSFGKIGIGLIPSILIGIIGLSVLISFLTNTLNYALQSMKSPTPLWATIVLAVIFFLVLRYRIQSVHSKETPINKFILKFNAYWDKDKNPHCPYCEKPLTDYYERGGIYCYFCHTCNKKRYLQDKDKFITIEYALQNLNS